MEKIHLQTIIYNLIISLFKKEISYVSVFIFNNMSSRHIWAAIKNIFIYITTQLQLITTHTQLILIMPSSVMKYVRGKILTEPR